ncbi:MAG TPA: hypothetical protein DEB30_00655 [Candidatus Peribacter riflensis]|uniref:Uncharacterized protein n=1 Tax=Candidatus Peribacter riflensis TaxID=1735162 RepID=A0A0S1STH1_9BACT|nr:MAG: hypothetical protein PeribacterA2_0293 [Candidatus Peribacter riflensis]OGJ78261.1 MAG: hypothetical protein A2398_05225 [Candidatus Peribacteria bacterium RIFOXYB1_FULL_57_12]OGJ83116.1 MAG: hypothetical protein A2412_01430 [Candidatus Peribacteria bacterium RIFOXYC1_FULL_58_8]ALM10787.1 MAG: hypothetical protein PeribacterB2_0293 [Candidatus Peribacter riflensis]ALM11889.1 MAG: hypothetical protein PeribacterC2_0292 [Candidatus Peribacter riflensis]
MTAQHFTTEQAQDTALKLDIFWSDVHFDLEQFRMGMDIELEHGKRDVQTNVTNDDALMTGKIALAHLREIPDYYTRLAHMEGEAKIIPSLSKT